MRIARAYFIYFIFFSWSTLSNLLPIVDSIIIARIWQLMVFILLGITGFTFLTHTHILSNRIIRVLIVWGGYVSFVNIIFAGKTQLGHINTFIEASWFPAIFITFYSIFAYDIHDKLLNKLIKFYPFFYFVIFILASYKMLFYFGTVSFGIIMTDDINSVFWILLLVPFAFLIENRVLKYIILFSAYILILASSKRGATVAISLVIVLAIIQDTFRWKKVIRSILLGIFLLFSLLLIFEETISKVDISVLDRFEKTNINEESRMYLYTDTWERFKAKEMVFKIIGSGHRSTAIDRGMLSKTSHNDFLEVLYNYGFLGLIIYLYFTWLILKRLKQLYKVGGKYFQSSLAAFIIFIVMSMVSHLVIYPTYFAFLIIFWAIIEKKTLDLKREQGRKNNSQSHIIYY